MTFFTYTTDPATPYQPTFLNDTTGVDGSPAPGDILVFGGDEPPLFMSEIGPDGDAGIGGFLVMPDVAMTLGADYPASFISPENVWLMPGSILGGDDNLGIIAPETMTIMAGATFDAGSLQGAAPIPYEPYRYVIGNVWNDGGALVDASQGELAIGAPGFLQTGGFLSSESNVSDGMGDNWIMLGDIAQGASVGAIVESIWNQTGVSQVGTFAVSGSGFSLDMLPVVAAGNQPSGAYPPSAPGVFAGSIGVDTSGLGAHQETVSFSVGGHVEYNLFINDTVV
jgi:hypothetical protein